MRPWRWCRRDVGHAHEANYLEHLKKTPEDIVISIFGPLFDRANAITDAMRTGIPVIYSTAFLAPPWHGFADFLRRGERPSGLGAWSYEAVDTKLAPSPRSGCCASPGRRRPGLPTPGGRYSGGMMRY